MPKQNDPPQDLEVSDETAIRLLTELVGIPSLSRCESAAVDWLVEQMHRLGFDQAYRDAVGNAIGIRERPDPNGLVNETGILLGHIDTVPGEIPVRIEDGRLFGRGSVDAKGSLASFVVAAARARLPVGQRWIVVGAVEEECSTSAGARYVATQFQPNWCVIGEPSGANAVTLGYKGRLQLSAHWTQEVAHSAGPRTAVAEQGIDWWLGLKRWCDEFNRDREKLFEQVQVSLEQFQTSSDGLLDHAVAHVSLRLPIGFPLAAFTKSFDPRNHEANRLESQPARIEFSGCELAHQESRTSPLVQRFNAALRRSGHTPRHKLKTGTSDMNVVAPIWKCPIVAYGPGDSSLDHTPREHLELAEYVAAIRILQGVLE